MLASGADQRTAMELAAQLAARLSAAGGPGADGHLPPAAGAAVDRGPGRAHRGRAGGGRRLGGRAGPGDVFLDLVGYTRLTEEQGDAAAADLAETLAVLVNRSSREHGGVPVKWLGDGVMVHYREPAGAVLSALQMVAAAPGGRPAAGPCRGRGRAGGGPGWRLLRPHRQPGRPDRRPRQRRAGLGQPERGRVGPPEGVRFVELGEQRLKGIARPVRLLEAAGRNVGRLRWPRRGLAMRQPERASHAHTHARTDEPNHQARRQAVS